MAGKTRVLSTAAARASPLTRICTQLNSVDSLFPETDGFIFDCDGVIWKGASIIDGAKETILKLREANKKVFFVTNNSSKSRILNSWKSLRIWGLM